MSHFYKRCCQYGLILSVALCIGAGSIYAQSYEQLWKQVGQAQEKSLPQTVIKLADNIFNKGKQEGNAPQMFTAYLLRSSYQEALTPDSFYVNIKDLEQWAVQEKNPVNRAILNSLLAASYANYAASNVWQLRQRTSLDVDEQQTPDDIREWTGNLFAERVLKYSRESLKDFNVLKKTSTRTYVPFVILGNASRYYGHDMYHVLVSRAVDALQQVTSLGAKTDTVCSREIDQILNTAIELYRKTPDGGDAVILMELKKLDRYSNDDGDINPLEKRGTAGKDAYLQKIDDLIAAYGKSDVCAEAYLAKANYYKGRNQNSKALEVCDEAIARYPKYDRIVVLKNLRDDILRPRLSMNAADGAYPGDSLEMRLTYCNLKGFTVQIYKINGFHKGKDNSDIPVEEIIKKYGEKVKKQHFTLLSSTDYQYADTVLRTLMPDVPGVYALQLIPDDKRGESSENLITLTRFKVLTLGLPNNIREIVALDAFTGHPIDNANISIYSGKGEVLKQLTTGKDGKATLAWNKNFKTLVATKGDDTNMVPWRIYNNDYRSGMSDNATTEQVKLLTDRSLYRPSQTIYVKGIAYQMGEETGNVIPNKKYTILLRDANFTKLSQKEVVTNEFGSFTADFILPSVCLNGRYELEVLNVKGGSRSVQVEDYKRPTFEVTFDKVEEAYQLGDSVLIKGTVKTFSGVPVQDASLNYKVSRRYNPWVRSLYGARGWGVTPLKSGELVVDSNGKFSIPVHLEGDKTDSIALYTYKVDVSVTSLAGETQAASTSLAVGNRSVMLSIDLPSQICKEDTIRATFFARNLSEKPVELSGEYRLVRKDNGKEQVVLNSSFTSNKETMLPEWKTLPSGNYEIQLSARDKEGRSVNYKQSFLLFSYEDNRPASKSDIWKYVRNADFDETHPAQFCVGTSFKGAYIMMDMFSGDKRVKTEILQLSDSIVRFVIPYLPEYGKRINVSFTFVKEGVAYFDYIELLKRLPSKDLAMKWKVFRDKLIPGQQEKWTLTVKTPDGNAANAEMLATMYDASLDKIYPNKQFFKARYSNSYFIENWSANQYWSKYYSCEFIMPDYPLFPDLIYDYFYEPMGIPYQSTYAQSTRNIKVRGVAPLQEVVTLSAKEDTGGNGENAGSELADKKQMRMVTASSVTKIKGTDDAEVIDPSTLRSNFSETAFFYPQLRTNEKGEISFTFTMPESLTRWNFRGYAHTKDLMTGMLEGSTMTAKDFMLSPNLPRFVRIGDHTTVAATITNLTGKEVKGTTRFELFDPLTEKIIAAQKQRFTVAAGKTVPVKFDFDITDRYSLLGIRLVADGGAFSDGEQHLLPVLSNKEYITETVALPIRGKESRTFALDSLFNRNSNTATNRRLTVEFTSNPAWYAVQALPALNTPQNDNAVSWATAFYANTLASFIANSQPRIKTLFDSWRVQGESKETLLSKLQQNQELKTMLVEETPWLMAANSETEQMARIATLFDLNNLANKNISALTKLKELQGDEGAWSWCKGMDGSQSMTTYIMELLTRLPLLTEKKADGEAQQMLNAAWNYLHKQALREYKAILKAKREGAPMNPISSSAMQYLYLIALSGEKVPAENAEAYRYYLSLINKNLKDSSISFKAKAAVILEKSGKKSEAKDFIASIKEHLVNTPERGAYFAFYETPYLWGMLPVSIHVEAMEALRLTEGNTSLVEDMKLWLLKQKQTTNWNSPVADADAIYALLCQGSDLLAKPGDVRLKLGGKVIETASPEAKAISGLGYIKETFGSDSPVIHAKSISVTKRDEGIAWGAVYAQYLEDISKVKQHGSELNVEKKLYVQRTLADGKNELQPISSSTVLNIGDRVISRLTLRLDRAMDFIQLKDERGACFEPESSVSGYRWNAGMGYYVEVKDASTNFFFDRLGKGVWVLEYGYTVARSGRYESGLATMQCAYAPEYSTHSASMRIEVK